MKGPTLPRWLRPQFSLKMLFFLVTLIAIWVGWQMRWIKQRRDFLAEGRAIIREPWQGDKLATAPGLLWIWGEPGQTRLSVRSPEFEDKADYHRAHPSDEAAKARKLFPEAVIEVQEGIILWHTWNPGQPWDWGKPNPKTTKTSSDNPFGL